MCGSENEGAQDIVCLSCGMRSDLMREEGTMTSLEKRVKQIERARASIASSLVKEFDADENLAEMIAADAIRQVLGPTTRRQQMRAWAKRRRKLLLSIPLVPAGLVLIAVMVLGIRACVGAMPPTYPRSYVAADTWRPAYRSGPFDHQGADATNGLCLLTNPAEPVTNDCLTPASAGGTGSYY